MPRILTKAVATLALALGCATGAPTNPPKEFVQTGEIRMLKNGRAFGASFSDDRIVGTVIDLARTPDGSWRGVLAYGAVDVSVYPNRLAGSGITILREERPGVVVYTGEDHGRRVRFEISASGLVVSTPRWAGSLSRTGPGEFGDGMVKLFGEAASDHPPWPQFALALIGTFR